MLSKYTWFERAYFFNIKSGILTYNDGKRFLFEFMPQRGVYRWRNPSGTSSEIVSPDELRKRVVTGMYAQKNYIVKAFITEFPVKREERMRNYSGKSHQYNYKSNDAVLKRNVCEVSATNWVNLLYRFNNIILYYGGQRCHYRRIRDAWIDLATKTAVNIANLNLKDATHVFITDCNGRIYEFDL